jgi:hypothetical protein
MSTKKAAKKRPKKKSANASRAATVPKELASKVLSAVPREHGFYFYSSMGNPTGTVACSFDEFCQIVKASPEESLEFHMTRGDFENWIRFLGDLELANQIERLRAGSLPREQMMQTFVSAIEERHDLLKKSV